MGGGVENECREGVVGIDHALAVTPKHTVQAFRIDCLPSGGLFLSKSSVLNEKHQLGRKNCILI